MATYARKLLSGSTHGRMIPVAATATPGTLIHTAQAGTVDPASDEIYLWASNVTAVARLLTLEWGGVGDPADHMVKQLSIPANSARYPISMGEPLRNALVVRAFADAANAINLGGYVNSIT
jgi:hypothetical protein